eukprot:Hpha_TRINITY_DN8545_c0_g1::TRINITY_DN8545_c0_g1_i1::g.146644::m.146644
MSTREFVSDKDNVDEGNALPNWHSSEHDADASQTTSSGVNNQRGAPGQDKSTGDETPPTQPGAEPRVAGESQKLVRVQLDPVIHADGTPVEEEPEALQPWEQKISVAERRFCQRLFAEYDTDGSGTIDVGELGDVMRGMGAVMTPEQVRDLFEQVDVDGSNEVSFQEFLQLIMLYKEGSQYMFFEGIQTSSKAHVELSLRIRKFIPDSPPRWPWNILVNVVVLLLCGSAVHTSLHSNRPAPDWMRWLELGFSSFLLVDMFVCANTAYATLDGLEDDTYRVLHHYATTWFVPDLLGTLPFALLFGPASAAARAVGWLRFFRLFKMPVLFVQSSNTQVTDAYILFYYQVVPIVNILFWLALFLHCAAELLILLQEDATGRQFDYDVAI